MALFWLPFGLTPRRAESGIRYGDIYGRSVASALDLVLMFLLLSHLFHYISTYFYGQVDPAYLQKIEQAQSLQIILPLLLESRLGMLWLMNLGVQLVILGTLYISVEMVWRTTPGKWLMGLHVVKAKTLEPVENWRYILRFIAYIPAVLPLMIGIFWASFNRERRGWHDFIAGTAVINLRPQGWYWRQAKALFFRLTGRDRRRLSAMEEPVREPATEERNRDGDQPVA